MTIDSDAALAGEDATLTLTHPDRCLSNWRDLIRGEEEQAVVSRYGRSIGLGRRPALLMVDFQRAYLGRDEPLLDQIDEYPASSGSRGWTAFRSAMTVLHAARSIAMPVFMTRVAFDPDTRKDVSFACKRTMPGSFAIGSNYTELPAELTVGDGEVLVDKSAASAFYGTPLDAFIAENAIDSLIVTGLSTSGCVRATVVDAAARGLRPTVVVDAVGDRLAISHTVALLDIWMKYGDLCTAAAVADYAAAKATRR